MKRRKIWLYFIFAVVVFGITTTLYMLSRPSSRPADNSGAASSSAALKFQAQREDIAYSIDVKGKSVYAQETAVHAPFAATVREWNVEDGDQVSRGDSLFVLETSAMSREISSLEANIRKIELEAAVKSAQTKLAEAEAGTMSATDAQALKRYGEQEIARRQEELDAVQVAVLRSQLEELRDKVQQANGTAPESGIFLKDEDEDPEDVRERQRIGRIVDLSKLQLSSTVSEYEVFRIKEGLPVTVRVDALRQTKLSGTVKSVSKFAKAGSDRSATAEFEVIVDLEPDERLIAGLSLTGTIDIERKEGALVIPTLAVQRENDESYVTVETSGGPEKRVIRIGIETPDKTEVLEGLSEGETVVLQ